MLLLAMAMQKVALSVVFANIKTLEIFSLEFVWSGPTEQNFILFFSMAIKLKEGCMIWQRL